MSKARVRVEAKRLPMNATKAERERNLQFLLRIFKTRCSKYGIPKELKERRFFTKKSEKRRRKKMQREAMARQEYKQDGQDSGFNVF